MRPARHPRTHAAGMSNVPTSAEAVEPSCAQKQSTSPVVMSKRASMT